MKTVIIPAWKNPYPVAINGKEQRFHSGKKVEVEDDVAEIIQRDIDAHASTKTPTPTPEKNTPLQVKIWLGEDEKWECDTPEETIIKAIKAGRIISCIQDDGQTVGYDDEVLEDGLHKITIGGHYSLEYVENGYDITKDVSFGFGLGMDSPYGVANKSRQCFNKNYLAFEAGSTIAVSITSAVEYRVILWFIGKAGAKKVAVNASFSEFDHTEGWQTTPMTCVIPDGTAYVWISLKRTDESECGADDITRITVRKVS